MKILVCISKAPDTTAKIAFTNNNTEFDQNGVQFIVNPYDEWYALVRGIELKEASGGSVTVINVGGADNDAIIRKALAIGEDDAVRIDAEPTDALAVAKEIAAFASDKSYDMILTGKETIDYNGSHVGAMLAELMNCPFISQASKLDMEGSNALIERDIQGGKEIIQSPTPFVASCAKGMAEARIPNMRGIMAARTKPLEVVAAQGASPSTSIKWFTIPEAKADCKMIDAENPEALVEALHQEAKVI